MKKLLVAMLSVLMVLALAGCQQETKEEETAKVETDAEYVVNKGKLIVGITDFEPMDYRDANGEWIGFDADLAKDFAAALGVEVEFIEIDWDNKIMELDSKAIDCIWNGMTLTDEVKAAMECSNPYSNNSQVIVCKDENKDRFNSAEALNDGAIIAEAGSAGAEILEELGVEFLEAQTQAAALMEVAAGTSDACVIDFAMAKAMTGAGTSYENLVNTVSLNAELYGVGFRKGSDLAQKLNDFFKESYADGSMIALADTYGITDTIIAQ